MCFITKPAFVRQVVFALVGGLVAAAGGALAAERATKTSPEWDAHVQRFLHDYFVANPGFAVHAGKHEFDGQFSDFSEASLKGEIDRLHAEREKAAAFKDSQLTDRQRFERDYLLSEIDGDLFWREVTDQPHTAPFWYADALDPDIYISREYAPLETRIKAYTKFALNVPAALAQIKKN